MEGTSTLLARHGTWDIEALRREGLRQADVDAALRRQNANGVGDVETVSLEPGGAVVTTLLPGAAVGHPRRHRAAGGEARRPALPPAVTAAAPVSIGAHRRGEAPA